MSISTAIIIFITLLSILHLTLANNEDEVNDLFCELNIYAKQRVENNLNVFPCRAK